MDLKNLINETYGSQSAMARELRISLPEINRFVCGRTSPWLHKSGRWNPVARDIAAALGKYPEEIWPDAKPEPQDDLVSLDEVVSEADPTLGIPDSIPLLKAALSKTRLSKRDLEVAILRAHGWTLDEIGQKMGGISRERVRQISLRTHRRLRYGFWQNGIKKFNQIA